MLNTDYIAPETVTSLHGLFRERVKHDPDKIAYQYYSDETRLWESVNWQETSELVDRWISALKRENFKQGDCVALMIHNSLEWVLFDQASMALGLIPIPLYPHDRAENIAYIIQDASVRLLFLEDSTQWNSIYELLPQMPTLKRIISLQSLSGSPHDPRLRWLQEWLVTPAQEAVPLPDISPDSLATIVYTSGTTGKPKGVMLTHENILENAWAGVHVICVESHNHFLSFLPLSHMLERTVGYYIPMMCGAMVTFSRSINYLPEDMRIHKPTVLITVPRIFERAYRKIQDQIQQKPMFIQKFLSYLLDTGWRYFQYRQEKQGWHASFMLMPILNLLLARKVRKGFGGHLRFAICGGAPLPNDIGRFFLSLGVNITQGYGLTEHSPVISVNPLADNDHRSVGTLLPGIEARISEQGELCVRSKSIMKGYWNADEETHAIIDREGWLHTGDKARMENGHVYITGRIKEIIVLSNGEKVPPAEIEDVIASSPLIDSVMIIGEQRPYLSALVVLNDNARTRVGEGVENVLLQDISELMKGFPGYAHIRSLRVCNEPWSVNNGLLTPTLKLRRSEIQKRYHDDIELMYRGH